MLAVATRLGLTCFGGPIAHVGYFRAEYVVRRGWLDEESFADLVALCQFLPGAASSKVGMSIGILRAGLLGGLMAWIGFTLPSAVALAAAGYAVGAFGPAASRWLVGLKIVAVAVVARAVWGMARTLAPDRPRVTIAILAAAAALALPASFGQVTVIAASGLAGWLLLRGQAAAAVPPRRVPVPRAVAVAAWALFFALLVVPPVLRTIVHDQSLAMFDAFYRSGALVFGGGHVVLPLLKAQVVGPGWVSDERFLAGYGLAQAVPGPLFTFAAYLGAAMGPAPNGAAGAAVALVAIFLPSALLTLGSLSSWGQVRSRSGAQAALRGVNAGVVGILLAALYSPVWTSAIHGPADFALALLAFGLLAVWEVAPWAVVLLTAAAGVLLARLAARG